MTVCVAAAPQVVPPENHFGQVDVNDLLSKLISNGIIKPSQPDAAPAADTGERAALTLPLFVLKCCCCQELFNKAAVFKLNFNVFPESSSAAPAAPAAAAEEEEEEEPEVEEDDFPDLTSFNIDDMKQ